MAVPTVQTSFESSLSSEITSSATSINIATTDTLESVVPFALMIEPKSTREEIVVVTATPVAITGGYTLTIVRGIKPRTGSLSSYTAASTWASTHPGGAAIEMTDPHILFNEMAKIGYNNEFTANQYLSDGISWGDSASTYAFKWDSTAEAGTGDWTFKSPAQSTISLKTIATGSGGTDESLKVSAADTTAGYLNPKLTVKSTDRLTKTITSPAGNEALELDVPAIATSAGAGDAGKIPKLDAAGNIDSTMFSSGNVIPTGALMMYIAASAPSGWLNCDGSAISRTTYATLFSAIGSTYGVGDGSTTFNLPDMRGRTPMGVGTGTGGGASGTGSPTGGDALTARSLADWEGEETHVLTEAEMPSHKHTYNRVNSGGGGTSFTGGIYSPTNTGAVDTSTTGSDTAANQMQPVITVNFIIKT